MFSARTVGLITAVLFFAVGLVFLIIPQEVLVFFNNASALFGLPPSGTQFAGFYAALAVAYMYAVSLLAWMISRHPREKWFPFLLAQAKLASAALSIFMFISDGPYLITITNFFLDAAIGLIALLYYFKIKRKG